MKILVLDNYDSFVYNLVHYINQLGFDDVDVIRNDKILLEDIVKYDKILLSVSLPTIIEVWARCALHMHITL